MLRMLLPLVLRALRYKVWTIPRMNTARTLSFIVAIVCSTTPLIGQDLARPRIEVFKAKRELHLFDGNQLVRNYCVALGTNPVPPKEREGDKATPEGSYFICDKNPYSQFYLSLAISYPNAADAERGLRDGLISRDEFNSILQANANHETPPWKTRLGGELFVHGHGSQGDWTWGCIALDNSDMEELYRLVPIQTPITIYP